MRAVVGGGAAGFFAAIACAEAAPGEEVILLEAGRQFLTKVRISGGGRCNVTNVLSDPRELAQRYPRGGRALIGPLTRFGPRDTAAWFAERGVKLHAEPDGRMFPVTNDSATIVDCLVREAREAGVSLRLEAGVAALAPAEGGWRLHLKDGSSLSAERACIAVGGRRTEASARWLTDLGHTIEPPVPSLFTFHIETDWLRQLPGVAVPDVEVAAGGRRERGPALVTHWGLSGPAILRLSAWGARELAGMDYRFPLRVSWLPGWTEERIHAEFQARRASMPGRAVVNAPVGDLPARLWEQLARISGVSSATRWAILSREPARALAANLVRMELPVAGKSLNKDEFVTCGGVRLKEVDLRTMESRVRPGLHFAGEVLDIDGITGGFNFQAAWTTGWIAGRSMAGAES